jgi:hypothetical protein
MTVRYTPSHCMPASQTRLRSIASVTYKPPRAARRQRSAAFVSRNARRDCHVVAVRWPCAAARLLRRNGAAAAVHNATRRAACCVWRVARGMLSVVSHGPAVRRGHRHVELAVHEKGLDEAQHLPVLHECSQCSAHRPVLLFGRAGPGRAAAAGAQAAGSMRHTRACLCRHKSYISPRAQLRAEGQQP